MSLNMTGPAYDHVNQLATSALANQGISQSTNDMLATAQKVASEKGGTSEQASINNQLYAQAALTQMLYQTQSAERAMEFSADEAEKQREWSAMMSNTAYQRSVADLKKAGLNPILAYTNGPASTPTGSSAAGIAQSGSQANVDVTDWDSNKKNATANMLSSVAQLIYGSAKTVESISSFFPEKAFSFGFGK